MENMENMENINSTEETVESKNYSRRSRSADNRSSDSRSSNSRPPLVFGYGSKFNIDEQTRSDSRYQFGWVPYIVRNEETSLEFDNSIRSGWECALASDYPQMKRTYKHSPLTKRQDEDELIKRDGMVFMRREIELKEMEDKHFNEEQYHSNMLVNAAAQSDPSGTRYAFDPRISSRKRATAAEVERR